VRDCARVDDLCMPDRPDGSGLSGDVIIAIGRKYNLELLSLDLETMRIKDGSEPQSTAVRGNAAQDIRQW